MITEFTKQRAVCDHYHKKTTFWGWTIWALIMSSMIANVQEWAIICVATLFGSMVSFIPACVRLYQYGRAIKKLKDL